MKVERLALVSLLCGGCASAGWEWREVSAGYEWGLDNLDLPTSGSGRCSSVHVALLRDEAEWESSLTSLLPGYWAEGYLAPELVDWPGEDALIAYLDCTGVGFGVSLLDLSGERDGAVDVQVLLYYPGDVGDTPGRNYTLNAFAECGTCEVGSVELTEEHQE